MHMALGTKLPPWRVTTVVRIQNNRNILVEVLKSFPSTTQADSPQCSEELTKEPDNYVEVKFIHEDHVLAFRALINRADVTLTVAGRLW